MVLIVYYVYKNLGNYLFSVDLEVPENKNVIWYNFVFQRASTKVYMASVYTELNISS